MSVRVFVVDDTAHVRKMLVQMLELSGFDIVGQAASGTEAVEHIVDADPQVVVVDYKMPGLDGIETAREIRAHRPDQAIILYTAYLDDQLQKEAAAAGVSLCVGKIEGLTTLERDIRRLAHDVEPRQLEHLDQHLADMRCVVNHEHPDGHARKLHRAAPVPD